jgi:Zn-dependent protease
MFIVELAILIYSVILHEIAHGFVADRLGDPTARLHKRLTLNPISHIDLVMTILLPAFLLFTGAPFLFGGAKPVPIDPFNFRDVKKDTALTALAGPATNLLIAAFFAILIRLLPIFVINEQFLSLLIQLLTQATVLNISLAIFNLLPVPPLDGSKVLAGVLPDEFAKEIYALGSASLENSLI